MKINVYVLVQEVGREEIIPFEVNIIIYLRIVAIVSLLFRMLVTISLSFLLKKVPRRSMYLGSGTNKIYMYLYIYYIFIYFLILWSLLLYHA